MTIGVCRLEELAHCALGYQSLQNQFFYVSKEAVSEYGIESEYLKPIVTMADLARNHYVQAGTAKQRLFLCMQSEGELQGTGALKYIRAMATKPAKRKKQGKGVESIKSALTKHSGARWYAPRSQPHKSRIWLRKAVDGVYAPFLFPKAVIFDQRCNLVSPRKGMSHQGLAALLISSVFAMAAESCGAASLGAGALELPTKLLRRTPVPDLRELEASKLEKLIDLASEVLAAEHPVDWANGSRPGPAGRKLDQCLIDVMGKAHQVSIDKLYDDLAATVASRKLLAVGKVTTRATATRHDIMGVAAAISTSLRPLIETHRFPEFALDPAWPTVVVDLPADLELHVLCDDFLGRASLTIEGPGGERLLQQDLSRSVAQVVIKALMVGRRQFPVPTEEPHAAQALIRYFAWLPPLLDDILKACAASALGTQFQDELYAAVLSQLHLHARAAELDSAGRIELPRAKPATV